MRQIPPEVQSAHEAPPIILDVCRARLLLKKIRSASTIVNPQPCQPLTDDPDDSIFLECAGTAKADYLVTGNTKHFPKGRWKYTEIVTPRQFIDLWGRIRRY
jgi:predicted nucleic acid-binding protein